MTRRHFGINKMMIIGEYIAILTPIISANTVDNQDNNEPTKSGNQLSTVIDVGETDESNDSFAFFQKNQIRCGTIKETQRLQHT